MRLSPRTLILSCALGSLLSPSTCLAENAYHDAREAKAKALIDFSKTVIENPKMTKEERDELYRRTVLPASKAEKKAELEATRKARANAVKSFSKFQEKKNSSGAVGTTGGAAPRGTSTSAPAPSAPEVRIDGSDIPREIVFGGGKPAPRKSASPAPTNRR